MELLALLIKLVFAGPTALAGSARLAEIAGLIGPASSTGSFDSAGPADISRYFGAGLGKPAGVA